MLSYFKRRYRQITFAYKRFCRKFSTIIHVTSSVISVLSFVAAVLCLVAFTVYIGFEHSVHETQFISKIVRTSQIVFIVNVLFNTFFNFKEVRRDTRVIKWIADILVVISLFPLIYPHPSNPWFPFLEQLLYSNKFLFPVLAFYAILIISFGVVKIMGKRTNPSLILSCSFIILITIGSFALMMPRCTYHGISLVDSFFVSTSAVCITGLSSVDVAATFTPIGILVIALLIQIGGLGVMTFTSFFALFFSGNTSIYSQLMVKDMIYSRSINSLLPSLLYILGFTIVIEAIGAVAIFFCVHGTLDMSIEDEIIFSAFHSLSAFCNAGFSNIEGGLSNNAFLHGNQMIYIVASVLILAGGIGFPILVNFKEAFFKYIRRIFNWTRRNLHRPAHYYDMNTKIVLSATLIIMILSSALFFIFEYDNTLAGMTLYEKIIQSVFNSFVPRSSGFTSLNPVSFTGITILMMMILMWIGGASQSTAGGIKVNTFAAILLNLRAIITGNDRVTAFGRTVSVGSIKRANAVVAISIISYAIYSMIIVGLEPDLPLKPLLFESASALFTVGLSLGVTPELSEQSKILLCTAMFLGRVGILSVLIGFYQDTRHSNAYFPTDNIIIN